MYKINQNIKWKPETETQQMGLEVFLVDFDEIFLWAFPKRTCWVSFSISCSVPAAELKEHLQTFVDEMNSQHGPSFIKVVRHNKQEGLIRSRVSGWRAASAPVVALFDAHVEFNTGWWAEPFSPHRPCRQPLALMWPRDLWVHLPWNPLCHPWKPQKIVEHHTKPAAMFPDFIR